MAAQRVPLGHEPPADVDGVIAVDLPDVTWEVDDLTGWAMDLS